MDRAAALARRMRRAGSFPAGATAALTTMMEVVEDAIAAGPWREARVLRGMVHLRPGGDYRGLVVCERASDTGAASAAGSAVLPSATAWTLVASTRGAVAVDVLGARITPLAAPERAPDRGGPGLMVSGDTIHRLNQRSATHLLAVPMIRPGGALVGMISLEVNCMTAAGADGFWDAVAPTLQTLADLATPALVALPQAETGVRRHDPLLPVVGSAMAPLIGLLQVFAAQPETLLITGPTGVGKSRLARWCHDQSARSKGPFQVVDLLTVPEDMQMAELFGWRKGAFTGALNSQPGCVARADGGTLFIDEIDKLSLKAQSGLLQLLEMRSYRVLGDPGQEQKANVRFIVGTNADLATAVAEGRFREDLYYRINVLPVRLLPLNERADEVPAWASFFTERRHQEAGGAGQATLSADAGLALAAFPWPGNLRQLDNVVRRAYAVALVEQVSQGGPPTIQLRHVERALSFEAGGAGESGGGLLVSMLRAARLFVDEALARKKAGGLLDLEHTEAFRGLVLADAMTRKEDMKEVFYLFGRDRLVESRNHLQAFRRELKRVEELAETVEEPLDPSVSAHLR